MMSNKSKNKWINALMGGIMLMSGTVATNAYGRPNEEPNSTSKIEQTENLGTYPLRGGESLSVEQGQRIPLSEDIYLLPFVEVKERSAGEKGAYGLMCPDGTDYCPGIEQMRREVIGVGSELEFKLNDNVFVYGRGAVGKNGGFYTPKNMDTGSSVEYGGGIKFNFELFGKKMQFKAGESYNNEFGPMVTGQFVIDL